MTDSNENTTSQQPAVEDVAAYQFHTNITSAKSQIEKLSYNGLLRVFKAVMEHPFYGQKPKFVNENEKQLVDLINDLIDCKLIMLSKIYRDQLSKGDNNEQSTTEQVAQSGPDLEKQENGEVLPQSIE